jgi:putative transposase
MSERKCSPEDYIQFLIASPGRFSCAEAGRVRQQTAAAAAHDSYYRLLTDLEPDPEALWQEAQGQIDPGAEGVLVLDDTTLDKPHARQMELVGWHFSGKHDKVVKGINLLTLLWTDGDRHVPVDYRIYTKGGPTKNQLFRHMLRAAAARGLRPRCVCFDSWYASVDNLKEVRRLGWTFLTRLKYNRRVRQDFGPVQRLHEAALTAEGALLYLPEYGQVKVFRVVAPDGDTEHWATNDWSLAPLARQRWADYSWRIEEYHRGLKQHTGVERCQARGARAQANHIGLAIRAFLRLAAYAHRQWTTWLEAKMGIVRRAVAAYLDRPYITLAPVGVPHPTQDFLPRRCA